jgi:hypothetical protein
VVPPGVRLVLGVQVVAAVLVVGWFATGNASAPDDGLQQLGVLSLAEHVEGVEARAGRPTMVVVTCPSLPVEERQLDEAYGLVVSTDDAVARALALPLATAECQPGYVLLDGGSVIRYRTYDPGWARHSDEQEVLLEHLLDHPVELEALP